MDSRAARPFIFFAVASCRISAPVSVVTRLSMYRLGRSVRHLIRHRSWYGTIYSFSRFNKLSAKCSALFFHIAFLQETGKRREQFSGMIEKIGLTLLCEALLSPREFSSFTYKYISM